MLRAPSIRLMLFLLLIGWFCRLEKGKTLYGLIKNKKQKQKKHIVVLFITNFKHTKLFSFRISTPGLFFSYS